MAMDITRSALTQIGNYDILAKIAEGGMGTVYKARRRADGLVVAIKIVPPETAKHPILLERFRREFQAAHELDHPNLVKAIEFNAAGPSPFLVMEFVDGVSLGQKVEREGRLPEAEAVRIIAQVCNGLQAAHKQGMVHRDVKPDNILLTADGQAKLTDLGLVKDPEGDANLTRTGRGLGTPHYMAPEQFRNAKFADVRCDVYSLGATLYTLVTGETPFGRCSPLETYMRKHNQDYAPPRQLVPGLSERVDWAVRRAMSADPQRRPASCKEFLEDLVGRTAPRQTAPDPAVAGDLWYMVYKDETGEVQTVKGTTDGIRRALRDRLLGDSSLIRVCRSKNGPFLSLRNYPEFRDLLAEPAPAAPAGPVSSSAVATPTPTRTPGPQSGSGSRRPGPLPPSPEDSQAVDLENLPVAPERGSFSRRAPTNSGRLPAPNDETVAMPAAGVSGRMTQPAASVSGRLPHLPIAPKQRRHPRVELVIWVGVLVIALGTAFAAYRYFSP
jgi:serine/threonine protein kinase